MSGGQRLTLGAKRARIDEDFKWEASVGAIVRGEAGSTAIAIRNTGRHVASSVNGRHWEKQLILETMTNNLLTFTKPQHTRNALDGSKLGTPAEETITYFCWEAPRDRGIILPPTVRTRTKMAVEGYFIIFFVGSCE